MQPLRQTCPRHPQLHENRSKRFDVTTSQTDRQTDGHSLRSVLVTDLVADAALVRLLAAVRELVVLVVALLVESLAAELAGEGLVAGVYARVRVERRAAVERFAARVARVRFLLGVYDLVSAERGRLAEPLAADLADERPCSGVHGHVPGQVVVGVEHLHSNNKAL